MCYNNLVTISALIVVHFELFFVFPLVKSLCEAPCWFSVGNLDFFIGGNKNKQHGYGSD